MISFDSSYMIIDIKMLIDIEMQTKRPSPILPVLCIFFGSIFFIMNQPILTLLTYISLQVCCCQ
jgi:hypothetical protein